MKTLRWHEPDTNLLEETIEALSENGRTVEDVWWVGGQDWYMTWDDFAKRANRKYYSGFGGAEVNENLVVVGDGWWLERGEYDGSEWWEFKTPPVKPNKYCPDAWIMPERDDS